MTPIEALAQRMRIEAAARQLIDQERILKAGQIWSTPVGGTGLGGVGARVGLGELYIQDRDFQQAVLTLGLQNLQPGTTLGKGRIYALIKYGIGTANVTCICDWSQTTSIALPVGRVNVTAVQVDAKGAPLLPMPAGYEVADATEDMNVRVTLTAQLAPGDRSSVQAPTLSQTINLAANVTVPWQVPFRGKRVMVGDARGQLGTDVRATVVGSLAANFYLLSNAADSAIRTQGVELQGGADNVQLNSTNGFNGITLCWFLDG